MPSDAAVPRCPQCGSARCWRDGIRTTYNGDIQRFLCRNCGYRFSETKSTSSYLDPNSGSMQKPIGGRSVLAEKQPKSMLFSLYKGAIDCTEHNSTEEATSSNQKELAVTNLTEQWRAAGGGAKPDADLTEELKCVEMIDTKSLKSERGILNNRQICVQETKNLAAEQTTTEVPRGNVDQKGAIVDFLWQLKRQNYAEDTIHSYGYNLQELVELGVNLFDPQSFIDKMTELGDKKTNIRKYNLAKAYKSFLNYCRIEAKLPKYKFKRPLPYVPPEKFLDQLIACALSDQMSAFLQTLKETGARPGEAFRLEWNDIDVANKTINISHPEKGCNPRILPISDRLLKSLLSLPHARKNFIFNYKNKHACGQTFRRMRRRAAKKLGNLELLKIDFYTYRYWRATEEYDRSHKDYDAVVYLLGHNSLRYVLLYKQLSKARRCGRGEEYIVREARTKKEAKELLEDGFDYVMDKAGASLFRKLK